MSDARGANQLIAPDVKLGRDVRIFGFVNLYGCEIGDETKIGSFVEIQKNARIGARCKISSHTFICEGVIVEDNVFIGHSVTFINDKYPRATNRNGALRTEEDWHCETTVVKCGASIGSAISSKLMNRLSCSLRIFAAYATASSGRTEPLVHTSSVSLS